MMMDIKKETERGEAKKSWWTESQRKWNVKRENYPCIQKVVLAETIKDCKEGHVMNTMNTMNTGTLSKMGYLS